MVHTHTIEVATTEQGDAHDVTSAVTAAVGASGVARGVATMRDGSAGARRRRVSRFISPLYRPPPVRETRQEMCRPISERSVRDDS